MEEDKTFMYGLVGGLIIIAIMLLLFDTSFALPGSGFGGGVFGDDASGPSFIVLVVGQAVPIHAVDGQDVISFLQGPNEVGMVFEDSSTIDNLGSFRINSQVQTQTFPGGTVKSGLLFGEERMRFVADTPSKLTITITSENDMGDFIILVNGDVFLKERLVRGTHEFDLSETGDTHIEFIAESSSWKLWAPALYEIGNVQIDDIRSIETFEFSINSEKFYAESLEFDFREHTGTVEIYVNSQNVYRGAVGNRLIVPLRDLLNTNTVLVKALQGSFEGSITAVEVDRDTVLKNLEIDYEITTDSELPGWIVFDLEITRPGVILIKNFHEDSGEQIIIAEEATSGLKILQLRDNHASDGMNTLTIQSSGDALFKIRDLHIIA